MQVFALLTADRHTHRYIMKAVCFAVTRIPHMGHLGVGEEAILKGAFDGNGQKQEPCARWEDPGV